jgi:hypothetical protein
MEENEILGAALEDIAHSIMGGDERHGSYLMAMDYAASMAPHAFGVYPAHLVGDYRPLEDHVIGEYRQGIYEPVSYMQFKQALNVVGRIFSDAFHAVNYGTEIPPLIESTPPEAYFEKQFHGQGSVLKYAQTVFTPCMLGDPNAILVMTRKAPADEMTPWEIVPVIWGSANVLDFKPGTYVWIESNELSEVIVGESRAVKEGKILLYYDKNSAWKLYQTGKKDDWIFRAERIDSYNLESAPFMVLGGEMYAKDDVWYYKSFFDGAIPAWNKLAREDSDQDGNVVRHAHPQKVLTDIACSVCSGEGVVWNLSDKKEKCTTCNGTGKSIGSSPYRDLRVDRKLLDENVKPEDLIHIVEENTAMLEFAEKRIATHRESALMTLNMQAVLGVNALNSGMAKQIDRQDLNLFLKKISDQVWLGIEFMYTTGVILRYQTALGERAKEVVPKISHPLSFDYTTLDTLLSESQKAREAGVHPEYIRQLDKDIAAKRFGPSSVVTKKIIAQIDLDPYYGISADDMLAKQSLSPSSVNSELAALSLNLPFLINQATAEDDGFLERPISEQREILLEILRAMAPEAPPTIPIPEE